MIDVEILLHLSRIYFIELQKTQKSVFYMFRHKNLTMLNCNTNEGLKKHILKTSQKRKMFYQLIYCIFGTLTSNLLLFFNN